MNVIYFVLELFVSIAMLLYEMAFITCILITGLAGSTYPDSWGPPDPCDPYRRPQLSPDSPEYKKVLDNVMNTAGSTVKQVVKVSTPPHQLVY